MKTYKKPYLSPATKSIELDLSLFIAASVGVGNEIADGEEAMSKKKNNLWQREQWMKEE